MMRRAPDHNRLVHGLDRRWRAASSVAAILVCWLAACSTASAPADASPGDAANLDPMCQTNEDGTRTCVCEGGGGPGIYACVRFEQFNLFRLPNDVRRRWFSAMQHRELG